VVGRANPPTMTVSADAAYVVIGAAVLLAAALPRLAKGRAFSSPQAFIVLGVILGLLPLRLADGWSATEFRPVVEHATELVVIVALFGVGLALDRPFGWPAWRSSLRLIAIGMPLAILAVAGLAWALVGLAPAAALLLAAALAPTDPVLASEVQVGGPSDDEEEIGPEAEDEVRFALTSEAGLNDGLAFPFVYAAILLTTGAVGTWLPRWFAWDLLGRVAIGVIVGAAVGVAIGRIVFSRSGARQLGLAETAEALVGLGVIGVAYGVAELLGGYGFLSVFVAALVMRAYESNHEYHQVLHDFISQIERLLTLAVLLVLGFAVARGLLAPLTLRAALLVVLLILVLRPLIAWVSLAGVGLGRGERATIAFFGVRGVGTIYYIAYGAGQAQFPDLDLLWATAAFAILLSALVHGTVAGPVMTRLERRSRR